MGTYFVFGAFETFLPVYLYGQGVDAYLIGIIFAVQVLSIALTKPFFGKVADRQDPRYQIILGVLLLGVSVSGHSIILLPNSPVRHQPGIRPRNLPFHRCHNKIYR